jgi:hypothetical protein
MEYNILLFLIIFLIILIIFIFLNKYLIIQENYHTYFLPFYNVESNLLRKFYIDNDYNKNYFKHKMNYKEIYIYSNSASFTFFENFNKKLLAKSKIVKTNLIKLTDYKDNINYLSNKNNSISNITLPIYLQNKNDNIKLISILNNIYLLSLTKLKYNFHTIQDIPYSSKIGILNETNTIFYFYQKLFQDLNKEYNKNNIIIYKNKKDLFNALKEDKIEIILFFSELPNDDFNDFLNYDFNNEIIILPFDLNVKMSNIFFKKNDFSKITYFDLNKITQKYLPKKFGNYKYFNYNPNIKLLTIHELLICNQQINPTLIDDIFSFLLEYRNTFQNTAFQIDQIEPSFDLIKYIPFHSNILKIFKKNGYITNIDSPNCKYFVGKKECTKELLINNGME